MKEIPLKCSEIWYAHYVIASLTFSHCGCFSPSLCLIESLSQTYAVPGMMYSEAKLTTRGCVMEPSKKK